jgi:hypothetical protein
MLKDDEFNLLKEDLQWKNGSEHIPYIAKTRKDDTTMNVMAGC